MKTMEAEEVQEHFIEVLREIEETGQAIAISKQGRIVATLVPILLPRQQNGKHDPQDTIRSLDELAAELSADLPDDLNVAELISEMRR